MQKAESISFVAVNYNNSQLTLNYIESIRSAGDFPVYICDNSSRPAEISVLENGIKGMYNVKLIKNQINAGYFAGLNTCLDAIPENEKTFVFIGNNDLIIEQNFAKTLFQSSYNDDVYAICPDVVTLDGFHQNPLCAKRMSKLRKWGLRIYYLNYFTGKVMHRLMRLLKSVVPNRKSETAAYIYMGIGACYILTPSFFRQFKRLPEDVFLWSEEALLAGKIHEAGGRLFYDPGLIVHHEENASVDFIPGRKTYNMAKASFLKTYKYY